MAFAAIQEPSATQRLLRLLQGWMREQARWEGGAGDWTDLMAESRDYMGKRSL